MQGNKRKKKPAAASAKASDRQNNLNNNNIPENEPDSNCQVVNSFEPAAIAPSVSGVTDPDCQAHGKLVSKEMPGAPEDAEEYSPPTTQKCYAIDAILIE